MKHSRFLSGNKKPPTLMLTSLLDMFTIILIFLLVSFEGEDKGFELNDKIELPQSTSRSVFKPAVAVTITDHDVLVDQTSIVSFTGDRPADKYFDQGRLPKLVNQLKSNFATVVKAQKTNPDKEAIIVVQADKNLEYDTLYLVLRSASLAGFSKYRLATEKAR